VAVTRPMAVSGTFLRAAPSDGKGRVLFISSGAAHRIIDGWALYCTTKAAGETFFDVVASQVKQDERISVVNIDPGQMDTRMQENIRRAAASGAYFPDQ